jgi:hypothetical protein
MSQKERLVPALNMQIQQDVSLSLSQYTQEPLHIQELAYFWPRMTGCHGYCKTQYANRYKLTVFETLSTSHERFSPQLPARSMQIYYIRALHSLSQRNSDRKSTRSPAKCLWLIQNIILFSKPTNLPGTNLKLTVFIECHFLLKTNAEVENRIDKSRIE